MDSKNFTPIPITDEQAHAVYRPYYSESNGMGLKPLFDGLIDSQQSCMLLSEQVKCAPSSLHSKLLYAIKWLSENHAEKEKYENFRKKVVFKRTPRGVNIVFKSSLPTLSQQITPIAIATEIKKLAWLDMFMAWTGAAKELDVFDSAVVFGGTVNIDTESEQALIKICAPLGIELELNKELGKFRAMR
jgi:hypothetical protein